MHNVRTQPLQQEHTLHLYGELMARRADWPGKLVLGVGEGCSSSGLPAACSLAGAACLLIEPNVSQAKEVLRDGGIDFLISTVDEALRTLKNEIRKARPLAVALVGDVDAASTQLQERGVQPDLIFRAGMQGGPAQAEDAWSSIPALCLPAGDGLLESDALRNYLRGRKLVACTWSTSGRAARRALDAELLLLLDAEDTLRRRWLQAITRYQRSADNNDRAAWVTAEERSSLDALLQATEL